MLSDFQRRDCFLLVREFGIGMSIHFYNSVDCRLIESFQMVVNLSKIQNNIILINERL